jgi:Fe-S oxidoreductase
MEVLVLWVLVLVFLSAFAAQVATRVRLIAAAPNTITFDYLGLRVQRFVVDVLLQRRTILERPGAGLAHAFVFWGFIAFGGYTAVEFLHGLGIINLTETVWFHAYKVVLTPFAFAVIAGIVYLLIRRVFVRPVGLGDHVSVESIVIALFITTLMVTFLLTWRLDEASLQGRLNWWTHSSVILSFLALIPASKHFHLVLSPITVFLKSPELGALPNLDFDKEQVGLETVKDLGSKIVLDALTCVECGRCQVNCPAWGAGKELNPKTLILQTQQALLAGQRDTKLGALYSEQVLWQCTTCGACENQCPVGIEHLPLIIGSRRGLVSNGDAPEYMGAVYNHLERRGNIWGLSYDQRQKFVESSALEMFDPDRHDVLVWLGCAGAFEADFQKSLRSLFSILRARQVKFGVLSKERCTGDPAKRTGNEYMFQELAKGNIEDLKAAGVGRVLSDQASVGRVLSDPASRKQILTSCPHCVKTIGDDYRRFGYEVEIVHSAVFVEELTRDLGASADGSEKVTYHDPCYLARYGGKVDEPRELLARFGADVKEPVRNRDNPYCCGAGGGLLFADKEEEPGSRISDVRFKQLRETGAQTVVTACPFCSIMLKGAQTSAPGADIKFVDLMTYVDSKLTQSAH